MFEHIARSVEGEVGRSLVPLREAASRWAVASADTGTVARSVMGPAVLNTGEALDLRVFSEVAR